ncbi:hypothetical protein BC830DRAFT_1145935 [Chytriomyces sp. MP71]|nr:hypothetical protein BC830DRAFT_1145935 [Chytriomyces sp. MP71]
MSGLVSSATCAVARALSQSQEAANEPVTVKSGSDLVVALLFAQTWLLGFKVDPSQAGNGGTLPSDWNNKTQESYAFKLKHDRSALSFLLKAVLVGDKLMVHAVAVEDGAVHSLEFSLKDTLAPSAAFPLAFTVPQSALAATDPVITADENPLIPLFKDGAKGIEDVLFHFKTSIVDKLAPNLNKEGYEPVSSASRVGGSSSNSDPSRERRGDHDGPWMGGIPGPDFRDNEGYRPIRPPGGGFGTGDIDLDPFGAAPGLIPPRGGFGGMHPGGGMYVGPDHPMFGGGGLGGGIGGGGPGGIYGGPGTSLPPGAVPPNARFDPIGPFGPRPMGGPGRGGFGGGVPGRGGFGSGSGGPGGFRMGPDNDEMPPPGFNDNMYM